MNHPRPTLFLKARQITPAACAALLCVLQMSIPWTVPRLLTEDGPSHLYTSVVAKNLAGNFLMSRNSHYGELYRFNGMVPNWGSSLLLGSFVTIGGVNQAEKLLMSFSLLVGFLSISYAIWTLSPGSPPWVPLTNVLLQVWFLWLGFYNFYFGMVVAPLVVAYFIRNAFRLTVLRSALVGLGLCGLFLTHLIAAAIAGLVIGVVAIWLYWIVPVSAPASMTSGISRFFPRSLAQLALLFLMMVPTLGLFLLFAASSSQAVSWHLDIAQAFGQFPMHIFTTASGRAGSQIYVWPAVLFLIALAFGTMRRQEWKSAKGGLACAVVLIFVVYLIIPDSGLGGSEARIRVAWGVCMWGGILVCSVRRLQLIRVPLAIYLSVFLLATLWSTKSALTASSRAVENYLSIASHIRPGATLVRLRYTTPEIPRKYGYDEIGRDPLFHADAFIASACKCIDLSDYQAPNHIFPVVFAPSVERAQQFGLWAFEGPDRNTPTSLEWLRTSLPVPIDYVIVVADETAERAADPDYAKVLANLNNGMRLVATSHPDPFVKLYERIAPR